MFFLHFRDICFEFRFCLNLHEKKKDWKSVSPICPEYCFKRSVLVSLPNTFSDDKKETSQNIRRLWVFISYNNEEKEIIYESFTLSTYISQENKIENHFFLSLKFAEHFYLCSLQRNNSRLSLLDEEGDWDLSDKQPKNFRQKFVWTKNKTKSLKKEWSLIQTFKQRAEIVSCQRLRGCCFTWQLNSWPRTKQKKLKQKRKNRDIFK